MPQLNDDTVYEIVVVPAIPPVTTPETSTDAMELFALLHTPPEAVSVNVTIEPEQTLSRPTIVPASGNALTVILRLAVSELQTVVAI